MKRLFKNSLQPVICINCDHCRYLLHAISFCACGFYTREYLYWSILFINSRLKRYVHVTSVQLTKFESENSMILCYIVLPYLQSPVRTAASPVADEGWGDIKLYTPETCEYTFALNAYICRVIGPRSFFMLREAKSGNKSTSLPNSFEQTVFLICEARTDPEPRQTEKFINTEITTEKY